MQKVQICQAEAIGNQVVEPMIIEISRSLHGGDTPLTPESSLEETASVFKLEAKQIEEALIDSLPGGTYDALLRRMLERRASHFVVPFKD